MTGITFNPNQQLNLRIQKALLDYERLMDATLTDPDALAPILSALESGARMYLRGLAEIDRLNFELATVKIEMRELRDLVAEVERKAHDARAKTGRHFGEVVEPLSG